MEEYVWISKLANHPLFESRVHVLLRRLAKKKRVKITISGPNDLSSKPYVEAVNEAVRRKVAGIMVIGWGDEKIVPAINSAVERGIPVVTVDSDIPNSKRLAHVGTDWFRMGAAMADELAAMMGDRGRVLPLGMTPIANIQAGFRGFRQQLAFHPEIEMLDPVDDTDMGIKKAESIATNYLRKQPDLNGIVGFDYNSGPGAAKALEKSGKQDSVKLVCVDVDTPQIDQIMAGTIDAAFCQKRESFISLAFEMLYSYNHGSTATGHTPGPINMPGNIDTGYIIVTKENAEYFNTPLGFEETPEHYELYQRIDLLTSMIKNISQIVLATDMKGQIVYANPGSAWICGYQEGRITGLSFDDLFVLTEKQKTQVSQCLNEVCAISFETLGRRRNKSTFPVQLSISPLKSVNTVRGMVVIAVDISEQRLAERVIQESEEGYHNIFDMVPVSIWEENLSEIRGAVDDLVSQGIKDVRNYLENHPEFLSDAAKMVKVIDVNEATMKLYGAKNKQELLGSMDKVFVPETYPVFMEELIAIFEGKNYFESEVITKTLQGERINVLMKLAIPSEKEKFSSMLVTIMDITERKRADREKKRLENQFLQAQKMEAIGTLAGGIAHNFNNLLMGILGNASLGRFETDTKNSVQKRLENIEDLVQQGSNLTNQLLGYAREGRYEPKRISLNKLVKDTSAAFGAAKKEIRIHQKLANDLAQIEVDQGQIEQVLFNLYVNAADAMPAGGNLYLNTQNVTSDELIGGTSNLEPGKYVLLTISDTGVGMDKLTTERVFEPFFTTKSPGKGTGLGLASSYGIIKAHGGDIEVYSKKRQGTTFDIYLPAFEKRAPRDKKEDLKLLKGKETILLIDDESVVLGVGGEMLEKLGYKVIIAGGGKEAVNIYKKRQKQIDLLILDMIMPDMGGGETYDQMKKINPHVRVLLASGYSIDGQATQILNRGCNGFIQKPFNLRQLSQKVREILDKP